MTYTYYLQLLSELTASVRQLADSPASTALTTRGTSKAGFGWGIQLYIYTTCIFVYVYTGTGSS